jgi:hypothetical protein
MEITLRDLLTEIHGIGFGATLMLMFSGVLWALRSAARFPAGHPPLRTRTYLAAMVVLAWATALSAPI